MAGKGTLLLACLLLPGFLLSEAAKILTTSSLGECLEGKSETAASRAPVRGSSTHPGVRKPCGLSDWIVSQARGGRGGQACVTERGPHCWAGGVSSGENSGFLSSLFICFEVLPMAHSWGQNLDPVLAWRP